MLTKRALCARSAVHAYHLRETGLYASGEDGAAVGSFSKPWPARDGGRPAPPPIRQEQAQQQADPAQSWLDEARRAWSIPTATTA